MTYVPALVVSEKYYHSSGGAVIVLSLAGLLLMGLEGR